jgi:predicted secreted protein
MIPTRTRSFELSIVAASVLFLITSTSGIGSESAQKGYVVVGENQNGAEKTLRLSELLLVDLPEQSGTGYGWQVSKIDREFLCLDRPNDEETDRLRQDGVLPDRAAPKNPFGGTDWQVFRMKPRKVGKTKIELDYARPWQPEKPAKKFLLNITVEK